MHDPVKWWAECKDAPGMDNQSKLGLLTQLKVELASLDQIEADLADAEGADAYEEYFEERHAQVRATIEEIEANLR